MSQNEDVKKHLLNIQQIGIVYTFIINVYNVGCESNNIIYFYKIRGIMLNHFRRNFYNFLRLCRFYKFVCLFDLQLRKLSILDSKKKK